MGGGIIASADLRQNKQTATAITVGGRAKELALLYGDNAPLSTGVALSYDYSFVAIPWGAICTVAGIELARLHAYQE